MLSKEPVKRLNDVIRNAQNLLDLGYLMLATEVIGHFIVQMVIHLVRITFSVAVLLHGHEQCGMVFNHDLIEWRLAARIVFAQCFGHLADVPQTLRNIPVAHELLLAKNIFRGPVNTPIGSLY